MCEAFKLLAQKLQKGSCANVFALGSKLSMPKVFRKTERNLCLAYGGASKLKALKLHHRPSGKKLELNMLLNI
jgi:hypothetical protein